MTKLAFCLNCAHSFLNNEKGNKKFCSNACKQAFYRRSIRDTSLDDMTASEKTKLSKTEHSRMKTCPVCGNYFEANGYQGKKRFCSNACKQRWHLWGKTPLRSKSEPFEAKNEQPDPMTDLKKMLINLTDDES